MLPGNLHYYYSYWGSLSTPPCTENVHWFVLADTVKLSRTQVVCRITLSKSLLSTARLTRVLPRSHLMLIPGLLQCFPRTGLQCLTSIAMGDLTSVVAEMGKQASGNPRNL